VTIDEECVENLINDVDVDIDVDVDDSSKSHFEIRCDYYEMQTSKRKVVGSVE
jgi:hypothetical protein